MPLPFKIVSVNNPLLFTVYLGSDCASSCVICIVSFVNSSLFDHLFFVISSLIGPLLCYLNSDWDSSFLFSFLIGPHFFLNSDWLSHFPLTGLYCCFLVADWSLP